VKEWNAGSGMYERAWGISESQIAISHILILISVGSFLKRVNIESEFGLELDFE